MSIAKIINLIKQTDNCTLLSPAGVPVISSSHSLPTDLIDFYNNCGGCTLYLNSGYPVRIVSPSDFKLANLVIFKDCSSDQLEDLRNDISWDWYIVGETNPGDYLVIDLSPERLGRCYDAFFDRYAVAGETQIIAFSFTDLLQNLFLNRGQHYYWLNPNFRTLGDAYE